MTRESRERFQRVREVFEAAEALPREDRPAYLNEACGDDAELRDEVEAMLRGTDAPGFLEPLLSLDRPAPTAAAGASIGRYRVLRVLGEGGMGVVYEAEQDAPRRRVALKTLRPGSNSRATLRRLEQEAEVLARLEHPGIARIYDAGVHRPDAADEKEAPYFAMEYVENGVDLVTHVERERLDTDGIVDLLLAVCDAVAHGHQQGVIHRDLKPANVLVGADGRPKIIDFGVARAVAHDDDARTRMTQAGEIVGTLHWMAPEQVSGDVGAVSTRTDVYALGLLAYRLLYGRGPLPLEGKPLTEVVRIVREVAPVDPRRAAPGRPQELAWIVLRALEKEPERRYASVSELAADLRRFRADLPVEAGPPSASYRLRKLVRRHRLVCAAGAVVFVALFAGGGLGLAGLVRAAREADKFRGINDVLAGMFDGVQSTQVGRDVRAADLLKRAGHRLDRELGGRPEVEAPLRSILARSYMSLAEHRRAEEQARRAAALYEDIAAETDPARLESVFLLAWSLREQGRVDDAVALVEPSVAAALRAAPAEAALELLLFDGLLQLDRGRHELAERRLELVARRAAATSGEGTRLALLAGTALARVRLELGRPAEAADLARDVIRRAEERLGPTSAHVHDGRQVLARALAGQERWEEAERILVGLVPAVTATRGEGHPETIGLKNDLAAVYLRTDRAERAARVLGAAVRSAGSVEGAPHPSTITERPDERKRLVVLRESERLMDEAAAALADDPGLRADVAGDRDRLRGKLEGAEREAELRGDVERLVAAHGPDAPVVLAAVQELGAHLRRQGRFTVAEPLLVENLERRRRVLGEPHLDVCESLEELGVLLQLMQEYSRSLELLEENERALEELLGEEDPRTARAGMHFATALAQFGEHAEALPRAKDALARLRAATPEDPELLVAFLNLFQIARLQGDAELAESSLRDACRHATEHVTNEHPLRSEAYFSLGETLRLRGQAEDALAWYDRAVEAMEASPSVTLAKKVEYREGRALAWRALGEDEEELTELLLVHELEEQLLGGDAEELHARALDIAARLEALGWPEEAAAWRER